MKWISFIHENAYKVLYPWHKEDKTGMMSVVHNFYTCEGQLNSKVQPCGMQVKWNLKLDLSLPTSTFSSALSSCIETGTPGNREISERRSCT